MKKGQPAGMYHDFLKELSKAIDRKIEHQLGPWKKSQQKVLSGEADALTIFAPSKERKLLYDFSEPVFPNDISIQILCPAKRRSF